MCQRFGCIGPGKGQPSFPTEDIMVLLSRQFHYATVRTLVHCFRKLHIIDASCGRMAIIWSIFQNFRPGAAMWRSKIKIEIYYFAKNTFIQLGNNHDIHIFSVSFAVEKTKHHSSYPMILGAIGGLVTILFLSLGIYAARKKYIEDKSIKERGIKVYKVYNESIHSLLYAHRSTDEFSLEPDLHSSVSTNSLFYLETITSCNKQF